MTNSSLQPSRFIDSQHVNVIRFAQIATKGCSTQFEKVLALYYAVRDGILYDPYTLDLNPNNIKASLTLERGRGYCIEKSMLMAAACRSLGIPARLGFANVRNHLATPKFVEKLRTDVFVFHGYVSVYVAGKWVKCTPVFNQTLCDRFGVPALNFDGLTDSILQPYNDTGTPFMEYLKEHGEFDDLPFDLFITELKTYYPHFFTGEEAFIEG